MKLNATAATLAAALAVGSLGAAPASAAMPFAVPSFASVGTAANAGANGGSTTLQKVQWRPGYYRGWGGPWRGRPYGHWRHRGVGPAIGAGIAGLIIGGAIAASQRDYRDRWEQCDETYRSFNWSDGTFQPYGGGPRELCPYLRG